jgi:hypothetical protein
MELESTLREPFRHSTSLEEVRKRMFASCEWGSALSSHGIHWIFSVIETLFEFRIGEHFVSFIEEGHFGF